MPEGVTFHESGVGVPAELLVNPDGTWITTVLISPALDWLVTVKVKVELAPA